MMLKGVVSTAPFGVCESTTWTVKLKVPIVVGVPLITPSVAKLNPGGRLPALIVHV
jgi:hypothetical protein